MALIPPSRSNRSSSSRRQRLKKKQRSNTSGSSNSNSSNTRRHRRWKQKHIMGVSWLFFVALSMVWMMGAYWLLLGFVFPPKEGSHPNDEITTTMKNPGIASSSALSASAHQLRRAFTGGENNNNNKSIATTSDKQSSLSTPPHWLGPPRLLSRNNNDNNLNVKATADVRGNLGPIGVVLQAQPGTHWLKDRWQAASDMHGTNIPGAHWVQLEFSSPIRPTQIVLDWEAAYADSYLLEASWEGPLAGTPKDHSDNNNKVWTLFDGRDKQQRRLFRTVETKGQSPGVKTKTPLHVIHTINVTAAGAAATAAAKAASDQTDHGSSTQEAQLLPQQQRALRYLRLFIFKSAMGWGGVAVAIRCLRLSSEGGKHPLA